MGELIVQLIEGMTNAELIGSFVAMLVGVQTLIRLAGEFFIQLGQFGKFNDSEDWMDSAGAFLRGLSEKIGSGLAWFGVGNK